jgi:hypothetical protein
MSRVITPTRAGIILPAKKNDCEMKARAVLSRAGFLLKRDIKKRSSLNLASVGSARISIVGVVFFLVVGAAIFGAAYIYQVNDLVAKGYEVRDLEKNIESLKKVAEDMKIKEVELRSMYNIEKETPNFDLVNASNITYMELNAPVAMK